MANINKIKVSGTTYSIQDLNATKTVELTQAQYDALSVKDSNTFYIITDAEGVDLSNYYTKDDTDDLLDAKQNTLVSGTNIKTINNTSILGSGNIDIQGGGVNVVQTTGSSTTDVMSQNAVTSEVTNAVNSLVYELNNKIGYEDITTSITSSSIDLQVPSAKAVNDKLGGLSLVKLTQAQYDALSTKDNNTLYVIVN